MKLHNEVESQKGLTPEEFLTQLVKDKKDGCVLLDDVCARLPKVTRAEIVHAMKNTDKGRFIAGRKGGKSRFLYGKMAEEQPTFSQPIHRSNTRRAKVESGNASAGEFLLRVVAKGQEFFLPIDELGLVPA